MPSCLAVDVEVALCDGLAINFQDSDHILLGTDADVDTDVRVCTSIHSFSAQQCADFTCGEVVDFNNAGTFSADQADLKSVMYRNDIDIRRIPIKNKNIGKL